MKDFKGYAKNITNFGRCVYYLGCGRTFLYILRKNRMYICKKVLKCGDFCVIMVAELSEYCMLVCERLFCDDIIGFVTAYWNYAKFAKNIMR